MAQVVVRHGGGLDHDGRRLQMLENRLAHLPRRAHRRRRSTLRGGGSWTGPETRTTRRRAPRRRPPAHSPSCRSSGWKCSAPGRAASWVGPAVIRTVSPSRSLRAAERRVQPPAAIVSGSASRPGPTMPQARYPSSGSTTHVPAPAQRLEVGLRGRVLPHVGVHRGRQHHGAGEGEVEGGQEIVRQAVRELGQQVRGGRGHNQHIVLLRHARYARRRSRASRPGWPRRTCPVMTLRPVRAAKVSGRTNSCAAAVMTTCTAWPRCISSARQLGRLVGRDAAADAEEDVHARMELDHFGRLFGGVSCPGIVILHQPAPHFFHGDDGGFLRGGGQHGPRAALQLPRALGGDDDEAVGALFGIVRNRAVSVVPRGFVWPYVLRLAFLRTSKVSRIGRICSSIRLRRARSARTMEASVSVRFRQVLVHHHVIVERDSCGSPPRPPAAAARSPHPDLRRARAAAAPGSRGMGPV